jgi:predicted enzyme related to lactoylglutathione lyase
MSEHPVYAEGIPCWVDVASTDLDRTVEFYPALFGWEAHRTPEPEAGGYTMFTLRNLPVAAAAPAWEGTPSAWQTYIWTDDAAACTLRVREAGGAVVTEPLDVFDAGRMAVYRDPTGAQFAAWQRGRHAGAEIRDEPGTLTWNECHTTDADAAERFYRAVFRYDVDRMEGGMDYRLLKVGDRSVAGLFAMPPEMGVQPNWSVVFAVADADEAVSRAQELGATVLRPPAEIPNMGRFAVLQDPTGAVFQVIAYSSS